MRGIIRNIVCAAALPLVFSGCIAAAIGGATTAGYVAVQERSVGNAVDDTGIQAGIKSRYLQKDVDALFHGVDVQVTEGRVLLTGKVPTQDARVEAVRLAWQPQGVKEVINEIQVAEGYSLKEYANDAWISNKVRGKLLFGKRIRSINYNVDTVGGVVYLMGIAQDQDELQQATLAAKSVKGVKKVVSHVIMKDSPGRAN